MRLILPTSLAVICIVTKPYLVSNNIKEYQGLKLEYRLTCFSPGQPDTPVIKVQGQKTVYKDTPLLVYKQDNGLHFKTYLLPNGMIVTNPSQFHAEYLKQRSSPMPLFSKLFSNQMLLDKRCISIAGRFDNQSIANVKRLGQQVEYLFSSAP